MSHDFIEKIEMTANMQTSDTAVADYIANLTNVEIQQDSLLLLAMMERLTGETARMVDSKIIAFGHNKNGSDVQNVEDNFLTGFAPRKRETVVYVHGIDTNAETDLQNIGAHKLSKNCLYIKRLSFIDMSVLEKIILSSLEK